MPNQYAKKGSLNFEELAKIVKLIITKRSCMRLDEACRTHGWSRHKYAYWRKRLAIDWELNDEQRDLKANLKRCWEIN